ncbi:YugE family protein [Bacillus cytotoxicus]|uniref:YugE family protein n=1 Tax=Bacillus cytotoxicus TaxID=580165 RepID=A0ACC6AAZ9_9BACI|nr:YugE family protein [Bacillus cytotoxicus]HDX9579591.1 DUF1871 family protein [Bacillus pseudomycoides]
MGTYEKMIDFVKKWDPFQMGPEFYETEASDIVYIVSTFDDAKYIAKKIQHIYLVSFDRTLPIEKCQWLAEQLLLLKGGGSCSL